MLIKKGFTLRFIISCFMIAAVLLTAIICVVSSAHAIKQSLITSYLDNNQEYAKKLAYNTNDLLVTMQNSIGALAKMAGYSTDEELERMLEVFSNSNKQYFNSVFIVDKHTVIQAVKPFDTGISVGEKLSSKPVEEAIYLQKPLISEPYRAMTGRLILLISAPMYDKSGAYQGFIGGTIYLEEPNVLSRLLNDHFYGNGSYVFVVDKTGKLIFHPDKTRLGDSVMSENEVVKKVLDGENGSQPVRNSKGQPFLAGYAYEPTGGWGIISQTPTMVVNQPVQAYLTHMARLAVPFFLLVLLFSWLVSSFIAYPLHRLAKFSEYVHLDRGTEIPFPTIGSSIYEMRQLQRSMKRAVQEINRHLEELNIVIQTDALTGLANRRTFDLVLEKWRDKGAPFSLIILDVDHFKQVNDTFGHLTGDAVLRFLATTMLHLSRREDVCFRYGGEEFGILVPSGDYLVAQEVAERLRRTLKNTMSPTGKPITISLGIATYPVHAKDSPLLISHADQALYESKMKGRNRTTVYAS